MPIQVKCPNADCAKAIRVNDELAGKAVRCPACKTTIRLPALVSSAPAPSPAASKPVAASAPAPKPAPAPEKTSPKPPPPEEDVPTLEGFDDLDDLPPAKGKITTKPAPSAKKAGKKDDFDDFTDEAPTKTSKAKKDDYDDEDDENRPKKSGKGKKRDAHLADLPDTLWEDCDLFRHQRLSTKGKFSLWKNSFRILNPDTDEEVGQAEENLPTWKGWLRMFRLGPIKFANWLTVDVEIREEPKGPVLFYMRKLAAPMPWQMTSTIEILDFRKQRIGYFKTKLFSLTGGFWIYDDNDEQVAELKGKFSFVKPRLDFLDVEGEHLGDICMALVDDKAKKKKSKFKMIWGNIPMVMTMNEDIKDHIPTRILFLAATMATQLTYSSSGVSIG